MQLIHVDPANVHQFWPHIKPGIKEAVRRSGLGTFAYVERCVLEGKMGLWLVFDGTVHASVVTEIIETEWDKFCTLTVFGRGAKNWLYLLDQIEEWARAQGCRRMWAIGRLGWKRLLHDYKESRVVLEKVL